MHRSRINPALMNICAFTQESVPTPVSTAMHLFQKNTTSQCTCPVNMEASRKCEGCTGATLLLCPLQCVLCAEMSPRETHPHQHRRASLFLCPLLCIVFAEM
uniref:Uncharacterized protein n=1 Tax=Rhipicephalus zambeziensis TaxID=60191 RepID=A0A224YRJ7_9ACAR